MHTRRESKMSAQGNTCTELIADALSLSNGIYQHAKQKTGFTLPQKKKKRGHIQSTMKNLRDSCGIGWECEDGVSRLNSHLLSL